MIPIDVQWAATDAEQVRTAVAWVRNAGNPGYAVYLLRTAWGHGHPAVEAAYAAINQRP